jgi:uncharacterized protein YggE
VKKIVCMSIAVLSLIGGKAAFPQEVQVNRQNRTIAVQVAETIEVEPELAIVRVGYHSFGLTQEAVYEENSRVGSRIIDALLAAGLKKESIETETARLGRVDSEYKEWTSEERKRNRFEAEQIWSIRVAPSEAQKVADQAIAAGANELQEVSWIVRNPADLEAKTIGTALAKARDLAEQMAQKFGGKIAEPLFVSNSNQTNIVTRSGGRGRYETVEVFGTPKPNLRLFPQKVRHDATLYVVFALE